MVIISRELYEDWTRFNELVMKYIRQALQESMQSCAQELEDEIMKDADSRDEAVL